MKYTGLFQKQNGRSNSTPRILTLAKILVSISLSNSILSKQTLSYCSK